MNKHKYSNKEYYFQILMMGLRMIQGLNLSIDKYYQAYRFFKPKLDYVRIKNNYLSACNINLLDNVLEKII
jgi:oxygen-independent coproporphyrinogen-3 oxidase